MSPEDLLAWEPILQSKFAIALLLLAGLTVITSGVLAWAWTLWAENRALNREFREYLQAKADVGPVLDNVQRVLEINQGNTQ